MTVGLNKGHEVMKNYGGPAAPQAPHRTRQLRVGCVHPMSGVARRAAQDGQGQVDAQVHQREDRHEEAGGTKPHLGSCEEVAAIPSSITVSAGQGLGWGGNHRIGV